MKIYTKIEFFWNKELSVYEEVYAEYYEYKGELARAGGGGSDTTTVVKSDPWEAQQPYLLNLFGQAQDYFDSQPSNTTASEGLVQGSVDAYTAASGGVGDYSKAIMDANQNYATGGLLDPNANPAFQEYLALSNQAIGTQYAESFVPQLTSGAVQAGNIGSSKEGVALGIGAGKYLNAIQMNTTSLTDKAYGRGLTATMQAQSLAPGVQQMQAGEAQFLAQAARGQYGLDTQADQAALERLQNYQALITGNVGGTTTSTGPGTTTGGISGAAGGALAGYGSTGSWWGAAAGAVLGSGVLS